MGVQEKLMDLWRRESSGVVNGWLPNGGSTFGPQDEGKRYLEISCLDLAIKYERQRFGERRPVVQSLVTWPNDDERITVSRTLGPSSFTNLHDGSFAQLLQSSVALTGDLPMNSGAVDVVVGLLAAPGDSLLDKATDFLSDLAELTQVPQLTAAAPVASKIMGGVDKLFGNDETSGLLALQTSVQADRLRDGYLVVTDWPTDKGRLDRLRISDGRLEVSNGQEWQPASGFNYFVLEFATRPSKPDRWQELDSVAKLVKGALGQLAKARSEEDVAAAGNALLVAMNEVAFEPNLTIEDRQVGSARVQAKWDQACMSRRKVLEEAADRASKESDRARLLESVKSLKVVGADVSDNLSLVRERAFR